uniref:Uncharacterized protein n=1 Tax=Schistocephalus solidus TaxID=70667 RepID=A0A0X3Q069_SCHSO
MSLFFSPSLSHLCSFIVIGAMAIGSVFTYLLMKSLIDYGFLMRPLTLPTVTLWRALLQNANPHPTFPPPPTPFYLVDPLTAVPPDTSVCMRTYLCGQLTFVDVG